MTGAMRRVLLRLFGSLAPPDPAGRRDATTLLRQLAEGQVRRLPDEDLVALIDELASDSRYKIALRGNTRFLGSVAKHYAKRRQITVKQRYAVYNILERAFPHNLPSDLLRSPNRS